MFICTLKGMPVYLFTFHAYRSWNADNPRDYVRKGRGILAPDRGQARKYDHDVAQAPYLFTDDDQVILLSMLWDACQRRGWRLHQVAFAPSHLHIIVS
jgi:hypothetical protein